MKVSKVFGCVLGLHFGVIAILLVQPGCRTSQPPVQTYTQAYTPPGRVANPPMPEVYRQPPVAQTYSQGRVVNPTAQNVPPRPQAPVQQAMRSPMQAPMQAPMRAPMQSPARAYTQERTVNAPVQPVTRPPIRNYQQDRSIRSTVPGAYRKSVGLIEASRVGPNDNFNPGFNAGMETSRPYTPRAAATPRGEFREFESVAPIEPRPSRQQTTVRQSVQQPIQQSVRQSAQPPAQQTVQVAGASFETYTVKKGDNLWLIAQRYNVSLNELYAANGLNKNSVLRIGQQIRIPVEGGTATVNTVRADTYQPTSFNQETVKYTVKRGDSLSKIANDFGTSVRVIKAANRMNSDLIRVGDTLVIPVSGTTGRTGGSSAVPAPSTRGTSSASATTAPSTRMAPASTMNSSNTRSHTVAAGEFPASIARKYGMTTADLLALNGITDPRKLQVGQVLKVRGSSAAATLDARAQTAVASALASRPAVPATPSFSASRPATGMNPVEIQAVRTNPVARGETTEIQADEMFEGAVEIPVIRLEE